MNGSLSIQMQQFVLNVQTENAAIARRIFSLISETYGVKGEVLVRRKMKLKKNNVYIVRVKEATREILADLEILDGLSFTTSVSEDIKGNGQRMRSYLRGAFEASGSVNNPETSRYHLEIYSVYEDHARDLQEMMEYFDLNAGLVVRRNGYITYLKGAEKITEFLILMGANNSMLKFEDVRIVRDMRNSVNRLVNCENANLNKTIDAARRQLDDIEWIESSVGLDTLDVKLEELARIRLENPEVTLKELAEMLPSGRISKSGINHRMRKITEIARKLREKEGE
jgi:DNA-binding protein WhiA